MYYKKKPVVVEAIQFNGNNFQEISNWVNRWYNEDAGPEVWDSDDGNVLIISSLENEYYVNKGDFIIRDIKNKFYPCKPDIFEQTYEIMETVDNMKRYRVYLNVKKTYLVEVDAIDEDDAKEMVLEEYQNGSSYILANGFEEEGEETEIESITEVEIEE